MNGFQPSPAQSDIKYRNLSKHSLSDASIEADVAKGRRDWAFSERDKVVLEYLLYFHANSQR